MSDYLGDRRIVTVQTRDCTSLIAELRGTGLVESRCNSVGTSVQLLPIQGEDVSSHIGSP